MKSRLYILLAVACGLGVVFYFFFNDFTPSSLATLHFNRRMIACICLAMACFLLHNVCMISRYRMLSFGQLSWRKATKVNILCEFTSAITPSAVGGSSLVFLYLHSEGLSMAKSTIIMLLSLFLDELFLSISSIIILLIFPISELFGVASMLYNSVFFVFCLSLAGISLWTTVLGVAIFRKPQIIKSITRKIITLPLLRKFKRAGITFANDAITVSQAIKSKDRTFWIGPAVATICSWCLRFAVVICLFAALSPPDKLPLAYARQWILWMISLISPTPGGSGLCEWMFKEYYSDFLFSTSVTMIMAVIWRTITYYTYLICGAIVVPGYIKRIKLNHK